MRVPEGKGTSFQVEPQQSVADSQTSCESQHASQLSGIGSCLMWRPAAHDAHRLQVGALEFGQLASRRDAVKIARHFSAVILQGREDESRRDD